MGAASWVAGSALDAGAAPSRVLLDVGVPVPRT